MEGVKGKLVKARDSSRSIESKEDTNEIRVVDSPADNRGTADIGIDEGSFKLKSPLSPKY